MQDTIKTYGLWVGVGAAVAAGLAVGMGLRFLATGALVGIGAGAALGIASGMKNNEARRLGRTATPALH
jgi:hypothetical protein